MKKLFTLLIIAALAASCSAQTSATYNTITARQRLIVPSFLSLPNVTPQGSICFLNVLDSTRGFYGYYGTAWVKLGGGTTGGGGNAAQSFDAVLAVGNTSNRDFSTMGNVSFGGSPTTAYKLDVQGNLNINNGLIRTTFNPQTNSGAVNMYALFAQSTGPYAGSGEGNLGFSGQTFSFGSVNFTKGNAISFSAAQGRFRLDLNGNYTTNKSLRVIFDTTIGVQFAHFYGNKNYYLALDTNGISLSTNNVKAGFRTNNLDTNYLVDGSLIHKKYFLDHLNARLAGLSGGSTYSAGGGIVLVGNQFRLGTGSLQGNLYLNANTNNVSFYDANNFIISIIGSSVPAFEASQTATYIAHDDEIQLNAPNTKVSGELKVASKAGNNFGKIAGWDDEGKLTKIDMPTAPTVQLDSTGSVQLRYVAGKIKAKFNWNGSFTDTTIINENDRASVVYKGELLRALAAQPPASSFAKIKSTGHIRPMVVGDSTELNIDNWNGEMGSWQTIPSDSGYVATIGKLYRVINTLIAATKPIQRTPSISGLVLTFSSPYLPGIPVFHNGLLLRKDEHYTETNPSGGVVTLLFTPQFPATLRGIF